MSTRASFSFFARGPLESAAADFERTLPSLLFLPLAVARCRSPPPPPLLVAPAEIGTGIGLAISTVVQSRVTQKAVENLGQVYDPNGVRLCPSPLLLSRPSSALHRH